MKATQSKTIDFQVRTELIAKRGALDAVAVALQERGIVRPLCILPPHQYQRFLAMKLIRSAFHRAPYKPLFVSKNTTQSFESLCAAYHDNTCDNIIGCGGAQEIAVAKILSLLVHTAHSTLDELCEHSQEIVPVAVTVIPFGMCDGNECQGKVRYQGHIYESTHMIPVLAGIDDRLTSLSSKQEIACVVCTALLELIVAIHHDAQPIMESWVGSALDFLSTSLEQWLSASQAKKTWQKISSHAISASCIGGICAENSKGTSIIPFAEALSREGFATFSQTAAALLPPLMTLIRQHDAGLHDTIKTMLNGRDPLSFIRDWIALSKPKGADKRVSALVSNCYRLLIKDAHYKELQPLISLIFKADGDAL